MSKILQHEYEYAGFLFRIEELNGTAHAIPLPHQHGSAYKSVHAMNALICWRDDQATFQRACARTTAAVRAIVEQRS